MSQIYILLSIHVYAPVCTRASVGVWMRGGGGGGGGRDGGREAEREGGMEDRSHGAAARRTHVIRGWLRRCWDDTGAGCWMLDAVSPRPRRVSGRRSES